MLASWLGPVVTRDRLVRDLLAAGLRAGDAVVVHSSLRKIGYVHPHAMAVIEAFQQVLTPAGTLVMPTFTFNVASWGLGAYDPERTPSRVGLLTELFRHQPGVLRSLHPTHSVAAWGRHAREIVGGSIAEYTPLGAGSPFDRARKMDAWLMLVGVGHERNSTLHLAECMAPVPYLGVCFSEGREYDLALTIDDAGNAAFFPIYEVPGSSEGFPAIEPLLRAAGIQREMKLGLASCRMVRAAQLVDLTVEALRKDPAFFLRAHKPSEISSRRLEFLKQSNAKRLAVH